MLGGEVVTGPTSLWRPSVGLPPGEAAREQIPLFSAHPGQLTESAEGGRRFSFHKTEFSVVIHGVEDH